MAIIYRRLIYLSFLLSFFIFGCKEQQIVESSRIQTLDSVWVESLGVFKNIRIYLPAGYQSDSVTYPVIYLHDGQNMFYDSTSFMGEWGIDESLDSLDKFTGFKAIAVAVDHGNGERLNEFTMPSEKNPTAKGNEYLQFLVGQLKPQIDSMYRTQPEPENTLIMGSSLGGLISHYAFFQYPEVFGKVGIFSPSYWYDTVSLTLANDFQFPEYGSIYLYGGGNEGSGLVQFIGQMDAALIANGVLPDQKIIQIRDEGEHNEYFWKSEFPKMIAWMSHRGF